jgi:DNA-binding CsgD family transcriptional regulator
MSDDHIASLLRLVFDSERWPEPPYEILSRAFRLTPAEADVAIAVVSGTSLAKIAADRGVKLGTVRAHLKAVFSKTHTRGQADLTRVLTRLAFLVPRAERSIERGRTLAPVTVPTDPDMKRTRRRNV